MSNVFRKLMQKEFGIDNYLKYFFQYREIIYGSHADELSQPQKQEVYNGMYEIVNKKDKQSLVTMRERMDNTVAMAFGITRFFAVVVLAYVLSLLILFTVDIQTSLLLAGILGTSFCFVYKLVEYMNNRCCFVDVALFSVYKEVLLKVSLEQKK